MEHQYTEENIRPIDEKEWYRLRVFNTAEIDPLYVIMGFLQEYMGGYSLHDESVDMFFVNEFEVAQVFEGLCNYYLASLGCESDVELRKAETGHSWVLSKSICEKLKGHFTVTDPEAYIKRYFQLSAEDDLFKTPEALYGKNGPFFNFKRYSYLLGVIVKNRLDRRPVINFANAGHKAQLAIEILREFCAFGDESFGVEYFFKVPHVTRIILSENNGIWAEIERFEQLIMSSMQAAAPAKEAQDPT